MKHIVSFSGGKDSTAMLLRLIEEGMQVDDIVFFDTGWEFPQMYDHIKKVENYICREIKTIQPHIDFEHWMLHRQIVARKGPMKGRVHRIGNGWPSPSRRWCTREKVTCIDKYCGESVRYIGFASDEQHRLKSANLMSSANRLYPLIEWGMTEADCIDYCRSLGFDWGGLYDHFARVSCFCCPLQRIGELKKLRGHFPELWKKMLDWEKQMGSHCRGFRGYKTLHDIDKRFELENRQMVFTLNCEAKAKESLKMAPPETKRKETK